MESTELRIYSPRLVAYEKPELFEPVVLGLTDDGDDEQEPEIGSYAKGPICIEAVPQIDSDILFLVKEKNDKIIFAPRKADAMIFQDADCANKYIQTVLKPKYGHSWSFVIWSQAALIK